MILFRRDRLAIGGLLAVLSVGLLVLIFVLPGRVFAQGPTHTVAPGETLFRIALRYNVSVETLTAANHLADPSQIYVGEVLVIPGGTDTGSTTNNPVTSVTTTSAHYTVQAGDTLSNIARKFSVTAQVLIDANHLTDPNQISVGQDLVIPGVAGNSSVSNLITAPVAPAVPTTAPTAIPTATSAVTTVSPTATSLPAPTAVAAPAVAARKHIVQSGEGLSAIARQYGLSWTSIALANNLTDPNLIYAGMVLQIPDGDAPTTANGGVPVAPVPPNPTGKIILVVLHDQMVYAFEDNKLVRSVLVSTGLPGTPTVQGDFKVYVKYTAQLMTGPGYYLPGVPWILYFYEGYSFHGTYWHHNWGHPMSHGCVNMPTDEAKWLYDWAEVGTPVHVQW